MMPNWDDEDGPLWDSEDPDDVWDDAPQPKVKKMTNLQIDDVLGLGELLRGAATEYKDKLLAAENPHDPTAMLASSSAGSTALGKKKAAAKAAEDAATKLIGEAEAAKQDYYDKHSNWCDLMASTLGKTTPEGKRILSIRANLKGRGPNKAAPAPAPAP
jgi:hypothetical protein